MTLSGLRQAASVAEALISELASLSTSRELELQLRVLKVGSVDLSNRQLRQGYRMLALRTQANVDRAMQMFVEVLDEDKVHARASFVHLLYRRVFLLYLVYL